jgi:simple sugar transport system permease protein
LKRRSAVPDELLAALLAVAAALLIGAVFIAATGHDPLGAYRALAYGAFGGRDSLWATLTRAAPIVGMGLATAVAFRAGLFNLGGEGQLVLGGLAGALVALALPGGGALTAVLAIAAAMLAGGAWAASAAWFQHRFEVPLLLSTLLMNYPARFAASYLVNHRLRDVESGLPQTERIAAAVRLGGLGSDDRLHLGILFILVAVVAVAFVIRSTRVGYRIRMTGLNARFARAGGVDLPRLELGVMFASGGLAGLVGAIQVLGVHHRFIDGSLTQPLWAWTGLMVALLSGSRPLGVLAAGIFFAAVQTGGFAMERATAVPRELSRVLQALIILLVAAQESFRSALRWRPRSNRSA